MTSACDKRLAAAIGGTSIIVLLFGRTGHTGNLTSIMDRRRRRQRFGVEGARP